jgi:hypothetical protein
VVVGERAPGDQDAVPTTRRIGLPPPVVLLVGLAAAVRRACCSS